MGSIKKHFYSSIDQNKNLIFATLSLEMRKLIGIIKNKRWLAKGGKILDCGCGDGIISAAIAKLLLASEVYGIDISEEKVKLAKEKGVNVMQLDLNEEPLPFEDNSFDLVLCNQIIEHLYDTDHLLNEIYRAIKENGLFIITTPNLASWYNRIILLMGYQPHHTEVSLKYNVGKLYFGKLRNNCEKAIGGHIRLFTYRALKQLLNYHNFRIKTTFGFSHPILLHSKIGFIEHFFQYYISFASYFCFMCEKYK